MTRSEFIAFLVGGQTSAIVHAYHVEGMKNQGRNPLKYEDFLIFWEKHYRNRISLHMLSEGEINLDAFVDYVIRYFKIKHRVDTVIAPNHPLVIFSSE